jgi:hypothetical protein
MSALCGLTQPKQKIVLMRGHDESFFNRCTRLITPVSTACFMWVRKVMVNEIVDGVCARRITFYLMPEENRARVCPDQSDVLQQMGR